MLWSSNNDKKYSLKEAHQWASKQFQILRYGRLKYYILSKQISRTDYLHGILIQILPKLITISLVVVVIAICHHYGVYCLESGSLRNFINGGLL